MMQGKYDMQVTVKLNPLAMTTRDENELIKKHNSHIKALAVRFSRGVEDQKDIEQIGRIALLKAARRWDSDRAKLWTYARPGVFGAMLVHATKNLAIAFEEVSVLNEDGETFETIESSSAPNQETAVEISDIIGALDVEEKDVIRLSLTGMGVVEIGHVLSFSKSEVWRIYQRAVSKMQCIVTEGM